MAGHILLAEDDRALSALMQDFSVRQALPSPTAYDGAPVTLRLKEAQILELLPREQGHTVSRDLLIERVWGLDFDGDERMVDRHVAGLRKALGTAAQHIKAFFGKGYRLGGSC